MRRVLPLVLAELPVGRPGSVLWDQTSTESLKGIGERHGRLENSQTEVTRADQSLSIPVDYPVGSPIGLGEQAVGPHETGDRINGPGAHWRVDPEVCGLGHTHMLAHVDHNRLGL